MHNRGALFIVLSAVFLVLFSTVYLISSQKYKTNIHIGDAIVVAEIADTDAARTKGLGGRSYLAPNAGMLLVFDEEKDWGIWMKDMKLSIDIVWLNGNKEVVDVKADVSPSTYPDVLVPASSAKYVLELPAGTANAKNIVAGKKAEFVLE